MPFIERPTASLTFTLQDETGSKSTVSFDMPASTPADVALTTANLVRAAIATITNCAVLSQAVTYSTFDTTPEQPAAGSRVERKGVLIFRTSAGKTARYEIPGIIDVLVKPSGQLNEDAVSLAALITLMTDGEAIFADSNGVKLASLSQAYERYRRTTRQMLPSARIPDADANPLN